MTDASANNQAASRQPLWKRLWPVYVIVGVIGVIMANGWHKLLSLETLRDQREILTGFVSDNFFLALAIYVATYVTATTLMLPGALWITLAGGFLFGLATGSMATVLGATLGASVLFFAARTSLGAALRNRAGPFLRRMEKEFNEDALSYMFAMRFMPMVPFPVANIAPALLGARYAPYALSTSIGVVPGVLAYSWLGAGLGDVFDAGGELDLGGFFAKLAPAFVALAVVSLLPVAIKRIRAARKTDLKTDI